MRLVRRATHGEIEGSGGGFADGVEPFHAAGVEVVHEAVFGRSGGVARGGIGREPGVVLFAVGGPIEESGGRDEDGRGTLGADFVGHLAESIHKFWGMDRAVRRAGVIRAELQEDIVARLQGSDDAGPVASAMEGLDVRTADGLIVHRDFVIKELAELHAPAFLDGGSRVVADRRIAAEMDGDGWERGHRGDGGDLGCNCRGVSHHRYGGRVAAGT